MISITKHGEGWTLGSEIYFGEGVAPEGYTHLCTAKGPQMRYGEDPSLRVEFPGEYDIHGIGIVCREAQGLLHYIIRIEDERYALIQDPAALETQETEPVNFRLCTTQASKDAVESMELEGQVMILPGESNPTEENNA